MTVALFKIDNQFIKIGRHTLGRVTPDNTVTIGDDTYNFVQIGSLYWTTSNLKLNLTTHTGDFYSASVWPNQQGSSPSLTPIEGYDQHGKLYCRTPAMLAELNTYLHDGWRLPTYEELYSLLTLSGNDWTKLAATTGWSRAGAVDEYGLSLEPAGDVYSRQCKGYGGKCNLWSSTDTSYFTLNVYEKSYVIMKMGSGSTDSYQAIRLVKSV